MGNCCSDQNIDHSGDIKTLQGYQNANLKANSMQVTAGQLACIIKVQAVMRGFITRKNLRAHAANYNMGMPGNQYDDGEMMQ